MARCVSPYTVADSDLEGVEFRCRRCEACRKNHLRHWIGRLQAEAATSVTTQFVTLTYGGGYENAAAYNLRYDDVQKFFKRLRKAGHRFTYVVVGEYGDERDRAHWHALIFFKNDPPEWKLDARINHRLWKLGFLQAEFPRSKQALAAYMLKYLDKPRVAKEGFRYSRGQCMGLDYLLDYARKRADAGMMLWQGETFAHFHVEGMRMTKPTADMLRAGYSGPLPLYCYHIEKSSVLVGKMARAWINQWMRVRPEQRPPRLHPLVQEQLERLNDHWEVTALEREALRLWLGAEEPVRIFDVSRHFTAVCDPRYPGLVLRHCMRNPEAHDIQYFEPEGRKIWQKALTDAEAAHVAEGDLTGVPDRIQGLVWQRLRQEQDRRGELPDARLPMPRRCWQHSKGSRIGRSATDQEARLGTLPYFRAHWTDPPRALNNVSQHDGMKKNPVVRNPAR